MELRRSSALLVVVVCLVAACGGGDDVATDRATSSTAPTTTTTTEGTTTTDSSTTTGVTETTRRSTTSGPSSTTAAPSTTAGATPLAQVRLGTRPAGRFTVPIVHRVHPGGRAYVGEQRGTVRDAASGAAVLDIQDLVIAQGERGFLGMAFDRSGSRLYVSYSDRASGGDSVIAEYSFANGSADESSRRELLRVDQPFRNHNGGDIHLGPDGYLYIALGDGGDAGDPRDHGQRPSTLLGSILRIDPTRPAGGRPYGIPSDNPFANGGAGAPEVYLWGVRNPWRISFDPANGDLWVADVGQNAWEEVTVLPAAEGRGRGTNLGWNHLEGTHVYAGGGTPARYRGPVFEYPHSQGCSITGGVVYRGSAIPELTGAYLFADLCRSTVRALRADGTTLTEERTFDVDVGTPISFGVQLDGEVLVLSQQGTIHRLVRG